ncbi:probable WRKY transcription factor 19 [Ricinus communis]|uniref:probable WRKY transcription factor 19 n=1 Tax=Ricinus communis TaxID=3988 RepID=UPI00201A696F|nr:probable WRKY transcription factor 19 [Ricinus communis]
MSDSRDMELSSTAFKRMNKLKFLEFYSPYGHQQELHAARKICNISLSKGLSFLPDELRYLYWDKYPLTSLPLNFCPDNLVQLHLIGSHVQQLCNRDQVCFSFNHLIAIFFTNLNTKEYNYLNFECGRVFLTRHSPLQCLENLKVLDLSDSVELIKIPDLSELSKLEVLRLRHCTSLVEIYSSIPYDSNLSHMDLGNCKNLLKISSTFKLKRLNFLSLEGCSGITEFPKVTQGIRHLILNGTSIEQVPSSIGRHTSLTLLSLEGCTRLESLPCSIGELKCLEHLNLRGCSELASLPNNICKLKCLNRLDMNKCSKLMNLPDGIVNLTSLEVLVISMCQLLNGLPENIK